MQTLIWIKHSFLGLIFCPYDNLFLKFRPEVIGHKTEGFWDGGEALSLKTKAHDKSACAQAFQGGGVNVVFLNQQVAHTECGFHLDTELKVGQEEIKTTAGFYAEITVC